MSRYPSRGLPDGLEPAWDIARLFPPQGGWSEEEYLGLPGNHLTEFDHGRIEVLEMPSEFHQLLVAYLYRRLLEFVSASALGTVLFAPFPVKLWEGKLREPDVVFMRREHAKRRHDLLMDIHGSDALVWTGAASGDGKLARDWLRSRGNSIEGGTSEIQLNIIAKHILGLPG